jgi:site-specific recombinase XerD
MNTTTQRINLKPAEQVLDGRQLDDLIQLWLDELARDLPPLTVSGYAFRVAFFRDWWAAQGPSRDWLLKRRDLAEFGRYLAEVKTARASRGLSYHSQNDALRRLRQMFRWSYKSGYTEQDYGGWLPKPAGEPPHRVAASLDDLQSLLDAATRSPRPARNRALLALLISTGIRRAEAASLTIEDLRIDADGSGIAQVTGKRTKANKSGRRAVAFDRAAGHYLVAFLDAEGRTSGPLFTGPHQGLPLSPQTIYRIVKGCVEGAGLSERMTATHDLRRAFATHLARHVASEGANSEVVADMIRRQLGHKHYSMTAEYSLLDVEDIREVIISPITMLEERRKSSVKTA